MSLSFPENEYHDQSPDEDEEEEEEEDSEMDDNPDLSEEIPHDLVPRITAPSSHPVPSDPIHFQQTHNSLAVPNSNLSSSSTCSSSSSSPEEVIHPATPAKIVNSGVRAVDDPPLASPAANPETPSIQQQPQPPQQQQQQQQPQQQQPQNPPTSALDDSLSNVAVDKPAHMIAFLQKYNSATPETDEWSDEDDIGYRRIQVDDYYLSQYPYEFEDDEGAEGPTYEFFPGKTEETKDGSEPKPPECDNYDLKVYYVRNKTGFEESKDFPIKMNTMIAGRYEIKEYLGSAAFSKAIQCFDHHTQKNVCIKIITNNKDFFDQSLDEIKLLKYINSKADPDEKSVLQLFDFFYYKEHLFIVCELLRDNLYEFYKYNRESNEALYFTTERMKRVSFQCLTALAYIHSLNLIHCDLKPENILMKSYSKCDIKVIDFGSSCFINDHLSSYVQSRAYRAPEVILGLRYDQKIDLWSLGCILAELWTGNVLFLNDSVQTLLARVNSIIGPFPQEMLDKGRHARKYYTKHTNILYDKREGKGTPPSFLYPKRTNLKARLKTDDDLFVDFVGQMLRVEPAERPTAAEALKHPWLSGVTSQFSSRVNK